MISLKRNLFLICISGILYACFMFLFDYFAFNDEVEWIQYLIQGAFFSIVFGTLFPVIHYYNHRKQQAASTPFILHFLKENETILIRTNAILNRQLGFFWVTNQRVIFLKHAFKTPSDAITFSLQEVTAIKSFKRHYLFDDGLHIQTPYKSYSFRIDNREDVVKFLHSSSNHTIISA